MGSRFAFASELKALHAVQMCPDTPDPEALDCYFSFGYVPAPRTIFRGVSKVRAAHYMVVSAAAQPEQRYWRLEFGTPVDRPLDAAVDEFEELLDKAVRCRLMSEVPLGAFLSGGIDSSLVVANMARALDKPVLTNSVGFDDKEFSELPAARAIAQHLGTDHREMVVEPKVDADLVGRLAWHLDEPHADSSAIPTWFVCQMTRRNVTVALSGDGGDEAFGGYTARYLPHIFESRIRGALPASLRGPLFGSLGAVWPASSRLPRPLRLKTILQNLATSDVAAFYRDQLGLRSPMREQLYSQDFLRQLRGFTPLEVLAPLYSGAGAPDAIARGQFTDINLYMTDDVLVKVDRMSMAHSLEVRCPLLDHRILEFAATLPRRLKLDGRRGKLVLRAAAERHLPESIRNLPKRGFSIPLARWLRNELRPLAESLLFDSGGMLTGLVEPTTLRQVWREHLSGARDHGQLVWGLLMLNAWSREMRAQNTAPAVAA
jgi:asparagine synthase (glutamine-hydrolysing)